MYSVTVRLNAADFSAAMVMIGEWLNANRYEPTRYKYDHREDAILVTVDFPTEVAAEAFAARFRGVYQSSTQTASLDSPHPPAPLGRKGRLGLSPSQSSASDVSSATW